MTKIEMSMLQLQNVLADLNYVRDTWDSDRTEDDYRHLEDTIKSVELAMNSLDYLGDFE